ncbi:MAG: response regulator [Deltaproteobacteria bacterium]|nr:response regulator [Deltaproteobacteria bacterium]
MTIEPQRPRVLVADNDPATQTVVRRALQDGLAYDVVAVADGEAALAALGAARYDVVVLDVLLPKRSGFDVCRIARARPETRRLPICVLTALPEDQAKAAALAAGADDFIAKPAGLAELRLKIHLLAKRVHDGDRARETAVEMERWRREHQDLVHLLVHDMRGPLSAMTSATALLKASEDPEDREFVISVFSDATRRLTHIIDAVATRSELEASRALPLLDAVDLNRLLGEVAGELAQVFAIRDQRLELVRADGEAEVQGDRLLLHQLVSSALLNGAEFAPAGSAVVACTEVTGTEVRLSVTDGGATIPTALAATLLEGSAHGELKRQGVRVGRAHALVVLNTTATLHGGSVRLEPGETTGLRLVITLPRRDCKGTGAELADRRRCAALEMELLLARGSARVHSIEIGPRGALVERHDALTPGHVVETRFVDLPQAGCTAKVVDCTGRGVELEWVRTNGAWDSLMKQIAAGVMVPWAPVPA